MITQTAACYRHHSIEQQLSRWLLTTVDHAPPGLQACARECYGMVKQALRRLLPLPSRGGGDAALA